MYVDLFAAAAIALPATALAVAILEVSQAIGLTRFDSALILGSMATRDPDRSRGIGLAIHAGTGMVIALCYAVLFGAIDASGIIVGACVGLLHGICVVTALDAVLPAVSGRIASGRTGPSERTMLEPPGWFGLNYGPWTPVVIVAAHIVFGATIGAAVGH